MNRISVEVIDEKGSSTNTDRDVSLPKLKTFKNQIFNSYEKTIMQLIT